VTLKTENLALFAITGINYTLSVLIFHNIIFDCIFDQINAASASIWLFSKTFKTSYQPQIFEW